MNRPSPKTTESFTAHIASGIAALRRSILRLMASSAHDGCIAPTSNLNVSSDVSTELLSIRKASPPDERLQCVVRLGMSIYANRHMKSKEVPLSSFFTEGAYTYLPL
ncbi:hypothetical protein G7Y79_00051g086890 [Physcia stellaris]|nr:hypothetical protein G7Y79_00051g086890 [Physcia stellaris]